MIGGETEIAEKSACATTTMAAINASNEEAMPRIQSVEEFWNLESIGITDDPAQDDDQVAMHLFRNSIRQLPSGRYCIRLPWREHHPPLPTNWATAYHRLLSTVRRLQSSPELLGKYSAELQRQAEADIIETTGREEAEHFLPHHAVINPKKLRIVIDASAHAKGTPSLNDCLYRGPVLLPDLCGILTRFRLCTVPVLADVQAAFHAIEVEPDDRRFCKILWLKDPTKPVSSDNLLVYRYIKLVFGAVCSPFILAAVLLHHFDKSDQPIAKKMARNTYVDNILLDCNSIPEAIEKASAAKLLFREANMNLREFLSHRPEVMSSIPADDILDKPAPKVLGVSWNTTTDSLIFNFPSADATPTRRFVLSTFAGIFDLLGIVGPCLLPAKMLFQQLWDEGHTWDAPLPPAETTTWQKLLATWKQRQISVQRHATLHAATQLQLHVFCDASENAFATAIYLRSEWMGEVAAHLLFSKNRLRPRKASQRFTIPRMELLAVLIGVRAKQFIQAELPQPITTCHIWSDSQIALAWIKSEEPKQQFEQRRLFEIRNNANATFHFIRSESNPADVASRGCSPDELRNHQLWWHGPKWLTSAEEEWPDEISFIVTSPHNNEQITDEEIELCATFVTKEAAVREPFIDSSHFSSMLTLLGATIIVLRWAGRCRPQLLQNGTASIPPNGPRTGDAYRAARIFLIKQDQQLFLSGYDKHPTTFNEDGLLCIKSASAMQMAPQLWQHRYSSSAVLR